jgi:hypothetical protein
MEPEVFGFVVMVAQDALLAVREGDSRIHHRGTHYH